MEMRPINLWLLVVWYVTFRYVTVVGISAVPYTFLSSYPMEFLPSRYSIHALL